MQELKDFGLQVPLSPQIAVFICRLSCSEGVHSVQNVHNVHIDMHVLPQFMVWRAGGQGLLVIAACQV